MYGDADPIGAKQRFGAFPGTSDLHDILRAREIDTLRIRCARRNAAHSERSSSPAML